MASGPVSVLKAGHLRKLVEYLESRPRPRGPDEDAYDKMRSCEFDI